MLPDAQHFRAEDFACHDAARTPYPEEWADRWARISALADAVRSLWGGPLIVISGYRTPEHNALLIANGSHNVASSSQHMEGLAVDLQPSGPVAEAHADPVLVLHDMILHAQENGQLPDLGGLGLYPPGCWVHVDCHHAPDGHLRRWSTRAA